MNSIYIISGRKVCEGTFLVLLSCIMIQPLSMGSPTILLHLLVIKICAYTTLSINLMLNSIEKYYILCKYFWATEKKSVVSEKLFKMVIGHSQNGIVLTAPCSYRISYEFVRGLYYSNWIILVWNKTWDVMMWLHHLKPKKVMCIHTCTQCQHARTNVLTTKLTSLPTTIDLFTKKHFCLHHNHLYK